MTQLMLNSLLGARIVWRRVKSSSNGLYGTRWDDYFCHMNQLLAIRYYSQLMNVLLMDELALYHSNSLGVS
jgi:hypothetical protein